MTLYFCSFVVTVVACIEAGGGNPFAIYRCVVDAIWIGSSCYDCICYVMEHFGVHCVQEHMKSDFDSNLNPTIEIII